MCFKIDIIEGHDPSSYFWFRPVHVNATAKILWDEVVEYEEEFSIEEGDVECFLQYFFRKHFDKNLIYNKNRYEPGEGFIENFEWYLTYNFFTYQDLQEIIEDIKHSANLLETDYNNSELDELKKNFSIFYMCAPDSEDYRLGNSNAIESHIDVVIDFYERFTKRLKQMIENNPQTFLISIMGP